MKGGFQPAEEPFDDEFFEALDDADEWGPESPSSFEGLSCSNCNYSRPAISDDPDEGPILKCHRYPPVMFVIDDEVNQSFPDAYEICGEHSDLL